MRQKGKIISWNEDKGFGFIDPSLGGEKIFIHIKAFKNRNRRPEVNTLITYALSSDKTGRPRAIQAQFFADRVLNTNSRTQRGRWPIMVFYLFFMTIGVSVFLEKIPLLLFGIYVLMSLLAFALYAKDKSAAKRGAWRTAESTLHAVELVGGWPGALMAQYTLRHKSKKQSFLGVFWFMVLINISALVWLFTPEGADFLHVFIQQNFIG
ncbi:MAG: DUF1294 domain-containing protein [Gammaproteobacteria bacterium]|nr:DUF1294 domain-containing protein [Gammaproteobacteria bacterium]